MRKIRLSLDQRTIFAFAEGANGAASSRTGGGDTPPPALCCYGVQVTPRGWLIRTMGWVPLPKGAANA